MVQAVLTEVIHPLNRWFERPMSEGRVEVFIDVLKHYPSDTLAKAMDDFKKSWKKTSQPQPADIKELCNKYHARPIDEPVNEERRYYSNFYEAADVILPTPIGQQSLEELWARDLVVWFMDHPNEDITPEMINKFRRDRRKAVEASKSLEKGDALLKLWITMENRLQDLLDRYKKTS